MNQPSGGKFFSHVPYNQNSTLHLIMGIGSIYIIMHIVYVVFIILSAMPGTVYYELMLPNTAIKSWDLLIEKPWTLLIYGITHQTFWVMFTNMIWLYLFGNVLQQLVSYKEIIPLYFSIYLLAGFLYLLITIAITGQKLSFFQGAIISNIGIGTAALALSPSYKMRLGNHLQISYSWFYIIFLLLSLVLLINEANAYGIKGKIILVIESFVWVLYFCSIIVGLLYAWAYKKGMRMGDYWYGLFQKLNTIFTPTTHADGWRTDKFEQAMKDAQHITDDTNLKG